MKSLLLNTIITLFIVSVGSYPLLCSHYVEAGDVVPTPDLMAPHHPDLDRNFLKRLRFDPEKIPSKGCENQPEGWITVHNRTDEVLMWGTVTLRPGDKKTLSSNTGDLVASTSFLVYFHGRICTKPATVARLAEDKGRNTLSVESIVAEYDRNKVDDWTVLIPR